MASTLRLAVAYLAAAVIFLSVSMTFEWASPIETPEGLWDRYREVGVRDGMLVAAGHAAPGGGWMFDVHGPRFVPFPFYAGAGPDSGGLYVAVWFVFVCAAFVHVPLRALW